jgi:hypothetical protein
MSVRWLEIPVRLPTNSDQPVAVKYDTGSSVVVYRDSSAYVGLADHHVITRLLTYPDVRELSAEDLELIQPMPGLPVTWTSLSKQVSNLGYHHSHHHTIGLGDLVTKLTRRIGIPECRSCARRRSFLNGLTVWGWWRRPAELTGRALGVKQVLRRGGR